MAKFDMIVLYAQNTAASAKFYETHLGGKIVASMPTFVMMNLQGEMNIGFWQCDDVVPAASAPSPSSELVLNVDSEAELQSTHDAWRNAGVEIIQDMTEMGFGKTFVAIDLDGNRIRMVHPAAR